MPCGNFLLCHISQSRTIINNHNGWWRSIFQKDYNFMSKNLHSVECQILKDGWQLITTTSHHGCNYNGIAQ